jgi:hypothetical protein
MPKKLTPVELLRRFRREYDGVTIVPAPRNLLRAERADKLLDRLEAAVGEDQ